MSQVSSLVSKLFTDKALELVKNPKANPTRKTEHEKPKPFNERSIKSLSLYLENILYIYLNTKGEGKKGDKLLPADIDTPHPIGPITASQAILMDMIARMIAANIRDEANKKIDDPKDKYTKTKSGYLDIYAYKILKEIEKSDVLTSHTALKEQSSLLREISDSLLSGKEQKKLPKNLFQKVLALATKEIHYCGIATEVIDYKTQQISSKKKASYLESRSHIKEASESAIESAIEIEKQKLWAERKTWVGVDKDGDPETSYYTLLGDKIKDSSLVALVQSIQENLSDQSFEGRRSYTFKKGVNGLETVLPAMDGLKDVKNVSDFLDGEKISLFKKYIEGQKYSLGDKTEVHTNIPLDVLADFAPHNKSMVLSDFPDDKAEAKKFLYQLLFASKAVHQHLEENGVDLKGKKGQIFMPLCEDQKSSQNFMDVLKEIQGEIIAKIKDIQKDTKIDPDSKNKQIEDLLSTFFIQNEGKTTFAIGNFPGPSDLTKRMGTASHFMMVENIVKFTESFRDFNKDLQTVVGEEISNNLKLTEAQTLIEYGRGTALRRGAGSVFPIGRTRQGVGMPSSSAMLDKVYHQLETTGDLSDDNIKELNDYISTYKTYVKESADTHRHFFNSAPEDGEIGKIVKWTDANKNHPLTTLALKNFLNNQGCRGKAKDGKYEHKDTESTRAIGDAANKTLTGLITEAGFPLGKEKISETIKDFKNFVEQPLGLMEVSQALVQMVTIDANRARLFGCPEDLINESNYYIHGVAEFLAEKLGIDIPEKENFKENRETRLEFAKKVADALKNKDLIKDPTMIKRVELLSYQLNLISQQSELLTEEITGITKEDDYKTLVTLYDDNLSKLKDGNKELAETLIERINFSNASLVLDQLANFAGMPLQEIPNVKECRGEEQTQPMEVDTQSSALSGDPTQEIKFDEDGREVIEYWPPQSVLGEATYEQRGTKRAASAEAEGTPKEKRPAFERT